MRALVTAIAIVWIATPSAYAQVDHPYGLDPYKPSHASLLRDYGGALVAQTPLLKLRKLDPYVPSHAALLRQIGAGLPLWGIWYAPSGPAPARVPPRPMGRGDAGRPAGKPRSQPPLAQIARREFRSR